MTKMTAEEIVFELQLHGWCLLEEVIPAQEVGAVRQSIEQTAQEWAKSQPNSKPSASISVKDILNLDQSFTPYLAHEKILGPARALWGPYIRFRTAKGLVEYPGTKRANFHADGPYIQGAPMRVCAPYPDVVMKLTTVWMFSDFSAENGGTWLIPGSHRAENNRTGGLDVPVPHPSEVQVTGQAGSVILFDSRLWHSNGENRSDGVRVGAVMTYFPWWLNQEISMPPGTPERARLIEETGLTDEQLGAGTDLIPEEVYRGLPADVKPLVRHWVRP